MINHNQIITKSQPNHNNIITTGWEIYIAALVGDIAALRPLVKKWSENEHVLNWDDEYGRFPLTPNPKPNPILG